jgi:hypothetical protein
MPPLSVHPEEKAMKSCGRGKIGGVCKFLVAELKRGTADEEVVKQVMKYTDWVCKEYAFGNYESMTTLIIAHDFAQNIEGCVSEMAQRYYTRGSHPVEVKRWNDISFIRYRYDVTSPHTLTLR